MQRLKPVRDLRKRLKLNQTRFAQLLGVNQTTVSQYETGRAKPSAQVIFRLLSLVGKNEQIVLLDELKRMYGIDEAQMANAKPSEFSREARDSRAAAIDAEQLAIDAEKAALDAEQARLDAWEKDLDKSERNLRGTVLITLEAMFSGRIAVAIGLFRCVCITGPVAHIDFVAALEHMARSGYIEIQRASEVRLKMNADGVDPSQWIAETVSPGTIILTRLLPLGLQLLNRSVPADPEVAI